MCNSSKGEPSIRSMETLPIVAAKLESSAQCEMVPVPHPHYQTAQYEQVVAN